MSGDRYVKELPDRVAVTWDVTEPYGNIQDFTWTKTINRFQAVLHKDGAIEVSRIPKEIPICLIGSDLTGKVFSEETKAVLLSLHGAGLLSRHKLAEITAGFLEILPLVAVFLTFGHLGPACSRQTRSSTVGLAAPFQLASNCLRTKPAS
jgi:hypothetical protein